MQIIYISVAIIEGNEVVNICWGYILAEQVTQSIALNSS
jgi:hypothetical protein